MVLWWECEREILFGFDKIFLNFLRGFEYFCLFVCLDFLLGYSLNKENIKFLSLNKGDKFK